MMNDQIFQLCADSFPFWNSISDTDRENLLRSTQEVFFESGTNIHDGGECTGIILIKSGSLRVYMLSEDGKEITLYRLFAGEVCVLSASCVLNTLSFDVFIDAEEDSHCVIVGGCAFAELSERSSEVKIFALEMALTRFSDVMWVMQQILFMSMDKRLAIFLLDEASNSKSDTVKLTHEQIAKYMGSAREVVSRMLKYFCAEGIVEMKRSLGVRIIDKPRLRSIANG